MLKILHKKPETLKDYTEEENWTPYNQINHLYQTLHIPEEEEDVTTKIINH